MGYHKSEEEMYPPQKSGVPTGQNQQAASWDGQHQSDYPEPAKGVPPNYGPQYPTGQGNYAPAYGNGMAQISNYPPPDSGKWNAKLCGCGGSCVTCCIGCWCPCILIGQNIEIIDRGATPCITAGAIWSIVQFVTGCGFAYSFMYRRRFREKYGLPSGCPDIITECCCQACSACQIDEELKSRNIDPSLGFDRVKHIYDQPADASAPPMQQMMH